MKAIVLTCDKYLPMTDHMIQCYENVWPTHPFQFIVPYQSYPHELKSKYRDKVQLIESQPDIKTTILTLLSNLDDNEWIYWCIDDKYLVKINEIEANKVHTWITTITDETITGIMFCRCRKLLENVNLKQGTVISNPFYQQFIERKNYCQFWIHQFIRVHLLRNLFNSFPDRPFIAKEMDLFIRKSPNIEAPLKEYDVNQRMLVSLENFSRFGESTAAGKLTKNCYESMLNYRITVPATTEIIDDYCFMGDLD